MANHDHGTDEVERQARTRARQALQASVSLVAREVGGVDIAPRLLIEGVDVAITAQFLAALTAELLKLTLPDSGQELLIRIGLHAANEPEADR